MNNVNESDKTIKAVSSLRLSLASASSALLFLSLTILMLYAGETILAALFLVLAIVFAVVFTRVFSIVCVSREGVVRRTLFRKRRYGWTDIRQVGVIGTKVFPRSEMNRGGRKYIYFSTKTLNEDELFDAILRWPPRDMPFIPYKNRRFDTVSFLWGGDISRYNTGDPTL